MKTLTSIDAKLDECVRPVELKDDNAWIIEYKGKRIRLASGKLLWETKRAASCALTNYKSYLYSIAEGEMRTFNVWKYEPMEPYKYADRYMRKMIKVRVDKWVKDNLKVVSVVEHINGKTKTKTAKAKVP